MIQAIKRFFERRFGSYWNDPINRWINMTAGLASDSGVPVSAHGMLRNSSVWRAVSMISGDISTLPCHLYRRISNGKERAADHPAYNLMRWKSGALTANVWRRRTICQALVYGNSYSRIVRNGRTVRLVLLHPDNVRVMEHTSNDGTLVYRVGNDVSGEKYPASDIFHIQGLTIDALGGLSLVDYARNTIGRHLSAEGFTDEFFKNGQIKSGWFTMPPGMAMSPEAQDRFLEQVNNVRSKKHAAGILEDGMQWQPSGVSPKDAMMIDMLHLTPYDVARFFNCPPHKLGITNAGTQSSTGEENGDYWKSTIPPWLVAIEMEAWDKLLSTKEQTDQPGGMFFEHKVDSLMRATTLERYQVYRLAVSSRILNPNECRGMENMNPYDGGDEFENPYTTTGEPVDGGRNPVSIDEPDMPGASAGDTKLRDRVAGVARDAILRCAKRLTIAGEQASKKPDKFLELLDTARDQHGATVREWLRPSVGLVAAIDGSDCDELLTESVEALFGAFHAHYLAASDVQPGELATAARSASERLLADAGAIAADLISTTNKEAENATS